MGQVLLIGGLALLILSQTLLIVHFSLLIPGLGLLQLRPGGVQLGLAVLDLLFQGGESTLIVRPAAVQLRSGIVQLLLGVVQFLLGVRQLASGIIQLLLGLAAHLFVPQAGPLLSQGVQAVHQGAELVGVGLAVAVEGFHSIASEIGGGVYVQVEILPGDVDKGVNAAAAQGGAASVRAHIQGALHRAHNGIAGTGEAVLVRLVQRDGEGVPDLQPQSGEEHLLGDALIRLLGQAALHHVEQIQFFRHGAHGDDGVHRGGVHAPRPFHLIYAVGLG